MISNLSLDPRDDLVEKRRSFEDLEQRAAAAKRDFKQIKGEVKRLKEELLEVAPLEDENGESTPLHNAIQEMKRESQTQELELEDVNAAIEELEQKINTIHNDPNVIQQYEATLTEIEAVEAQLAQVEGSKDSLGRKIEQELAPYKASLENSIQEINTRFVEYMKELGVTGEVRLKRGGEKGNEDIDYKNWGIEIRVSFREGVKAEVLSARVQ
jgi:chromosome segregation ATPase